MLRRLRSRVTTGPLGAMFSLTLGQGFAQLMTAAAFLLMAHQFSVATFGWVASVYGGAMFIAVLFDFGVSNLAVRILVRDNQDPQFAALYRSRLALVVALTGSLLLCYALFDSHEIVLGGILGVWTGLDRFMSAPVRADLRMTTIGVVAVSERLLTLIATATVVRFTNDPVSFLIVSCLSTAFGCLLLRASWGSQSALMVRGRAGFRLSNPYAGARHLGLSSVAVGIQSLDSLIIASVAGAHVAGIFAAVGRWTQPLGLVAQGITQTVYVDASDESSPERGTQVLALGLKLLVVSAVPILFVGISAPFIVELLLGPEYSDSSTVLRLLCVAVTIGAVNAPLSAFLQGKNEERFTFRVLSVLVPTQLCLMAVLAVRSGAVGASSAVAVCQFLILIFLSRRAWRNTTRAAVE